MKEKDITRQIRNVLKTYGRTTMNCGANNFQLLLRKTNTMAIIGKQFHVVSR